MAQGFQLQINNATDGTLTLGVRQSSGFQAQNKPPTTLAAKATTGQMYFEAASNSAIGILQLNFGVMSGPNAGATSDLYLHFDPTTTIEFPGYLYIAGAGPLLYDSSSSTYIYPYMVLNQVFGQYTWPFGNLTFVKVTTPTLPYYPFPPQ
jgi:hypothetical protein